MMFILTCGNVSQKYTNNIIFYKNGSVLIKVSFFVNLVEPIWVCSSELRDMTRYRQHECFDAGH
jgi:hypothetical protein